MNEPTRVLEYAELPCLSNFRPLCGATRSEDLVARANALDTTALTMVSGISVPLIVRAHMKATEYEHCLLIASQLQDQCDAPFTQGGTACDLNGYRYLGGFITKLNYWIALNEHCGVLRFFQTRLASDDVARCSRGSFA